VRALRRRAPDIRFEGLGGPAMEAEGVDLRVRMDGLNVMGFVRVAGLAATFARLLRDLLAWLRTEPPDGLVLVDYPGFNQRLARAARPLGVPTIQVVAPQVWAWAPWRIRRVGESVDRIVSVLPFEPPLFAGGGGDAVFTGHPLAERFEGATVRPWREGEGWIGLLPGSRKREVERLLPLQLEVARRLAERVPDARFVVPASGPAIREIVERRLAGSPLEVEVVEGRTDEVFASLRSAIVASGTATLELALHGVPMVVVYPITWLERWLRPALLISPHFALANIVAGGAVVEERLVRGDGGRGRGAGRGPRAGPSSRPGAGSLRRGPRARP
jgi:lipid-A-disaccharide synthase